MTQHAELTPERWARFTLAQQVLQIGAEMQRATRLLKPERLELLRGCYERALQLVDLTAEVNPSPNLRRELMLWRGVIEELREREQPDAATHRSAFRVLLQLHPESAQQIPLLGL